MTLRLMFGLCLSLAIAPACKLDADRATARSSQNAATHKANREARIAALAAIVDAELPRSEPGDEEAGAELPVEASLAVTSPVDRGPPVDPLASMARPEVAGEEQWPRDPEPADERDHEALERTRGDGDDEREQEVEEEEEEAAEDEEQEEEDEEQEEEDEGDEGDEDEGGEQEEDEEDEEAEDGEADEEGEDGDGGERAADPAAS